MRRLGHGPNESTATGLHAGSTGTIPMRTPEELARIVSILDGIVRPTTAETIEYVLLNEERTQAHMEETREQREQDMLSALSGTAKPKSKTKEGFPKQILIESLQGMILSYQQFGADEEVLAQAHRRLDELQGRKKK